MAPKRSLGLGQAARAKKQKGSIDTNSSADQLTVELGEEVAANDAIAQLKALWRNFIDSSERSELMLNGIIHECDRILRKAHRGENGEIKDKENTKKDTKKDGEESKPKEKEGGEEKEEKEEKEEEEQEEEIVLSGEFYGIYGLALSMLGFFHTEEPQKVSEFFKEAQERINTGFEKYPKSVALMFAQARILINRIPLMEVSAMTLDSRTSSHTKDPASSLDECLSVWEEAEKVAELSEAYDYFSLENSDFLQALDDLLDMVDNFGREKSHAGQTEGEGEGDEDDDEDEDEEEEEEVVLNSSHPLYAIVQTDKYNVWWRDHTVRFLENLNRKIERAGAENGNSGSSMSRDHDLVLRRELSKRLGQSYLMEAEAPSNIFTTLAYFEKDKKSLNGMTLEEARAATQKLLQTALEYLKVAQDEEDPDSWAAVAEAMISLGNTYDLDSEIQEKTYQDAEKLLMRANNATNGRYEKILENLAQAD